MQLDLNSVAMCTQHRSKAATGPGKKLGNSTGRRMNVRLGRSRRSKKQTSNRRKSAANRYVMVDCPGCEANPKIFAYTNDHYAGHGPATVKLFYDLWSEKR